MGSNNVPLPILKPCQSNRIIYILSDWGDSLGSGHIQRMSTLLWHLNQREGIRAFLVSNSIPHFLSSEIFKYTKKQIDTKPDIIIRDMRNSSTEEIEKLKSLSRVMVIDDAGDGRDVADFTIDLLPNYSNLQKEESSTRNTFFLYGFNFVKSLLSIINKSIPKVIDFSIYPGLAANDKYLDLLLSLLPKGSSYAIHLGENSYSNYGEKIDRSYAELILSSRIIVSHFGIMLYEGFISGCRLVSVNPTLYHCQLSKLVEKRLNILNLGMYNDLNRDMVLLKIEELLNEPICESISAKEVYNRVFEKLEKFSDYIIELT
ncbi:MAG: hypothetical protein SVZ03_04855 [Spirochaetota bacterium]|nr:hypothetical protein [Spirochaetota bacterium]